jgi:hypothetical protein
MNLTTLTSANEPKNGQPSLNGVGIPRADAVGHTQSLSELVSDIHVMENMVRYYENRILRKRIAIAELLHGAEDREIPATQRVAGPVRNANPRQNSTVRQMLESVLPEISDTPLRYPELLNVMRKRYPDQIGKIRRGIRSACDELRRRGALIKVSRGTIKNAPAR